MPKEKVTKPHHKLAVTTVSLVSFHDLLPCFPNDTLILNPFSLYTHRHDKILSGVNDDDELWPWMKDSDELLIIQVLVLESTPWYAGVLRNLLLSLCELFIMAVVLMVCCHSYDEDWLWWMLSHQLAACFLSCPVLRCIPFSFPLMKAISKSISDLWFPFSFLKYPSHVWRRFPSSAGVLGTVLCHWILSSYPRISFFNSMCFLSVWHYCVWLLSWFVLQWVCVILWKGSSFSSFQYSYDLREWWIVYRLQVLRYTTEAECNPSYVGPVVIGLWVVFSCCDDAPIVAWLWQFGGVVPDTVRMPFFPIAYPSLLCVRCVAGRYSIVRGLG